MTADEKKHFILDIIVNTPSTTRFDTSFIASVLRLTISEVNTLCRELIAVNDLKNASSKENIGTITVMCFTQGADSFNTAKYLYLNSMDNIEFEVLNFLYDKSISTQTRINHILVSSSHTVYETTETLKKMVDQDFIKMQPPPVDLRYNDTKPIENHVIAFEDINRPIKASITIHGKTYFKQQYMDNNKPNQNFYGQTNYIEGDNHGEQNLFIKETNKIHKADPKTLLMKIWNLVSKNPLVSALLSAIIIFIASSLWNSIVKLNKQSDNVNRSDTTLQTR